MPIFNMCVEAEVQKLQPATTVPFGQTIGIVGMQLKILVW